MRLLAVCVLLLLACDDEATIQPDAATAPDGPPVPAIDWSIWGGDCTRSILGPESCLAADGVTRGRCILTSTVGTNGRYPGRCWHHCITEPPHAYACPSDGIAVHDSQYSQGCVCQPH